MTANKTRGRLAALLLAVITPLVAEFTLGNPPLRMAWLLLLWIPIYGAGVVLVRELVRRAGTGWTGVLLLGAAYGIVEEGLALQALSSPTMYGAAGWAPRILGLNSAYTELQIPYHAVFSAAIPILLTDLIVPSLRDRPYLGRLGTWVAGVVFVLGALLLRVTVVTTIDPGYQAPPAILAGCAAAVALLVAAGLRLRSRPRAAATRPPAPAAAGLFGAVAAFAYLALLFPFGGATRPAFTHGGWVLVPMSAAVVVAVAVAWLLRRWTADGRWTDRHSLALASGALVAHTAFGLISNTDTAADRAGLAAVGVVMAGLLAVLGRRVAGLLRFCE
ncbi:hypothetical protein [Microbispora amethystogenes]|uniref:Uncharacterized protein n=1 Tax=Microbispora amethystogenes TaxID=1427754 RepID=A0ABQ4FDZ5_9ACTN|nr:hypothetical protein [Microbispora amethystogenes]GIH33059.1 hypothetical protein Mam01_32230 [Microbispora amethystogenes]